MCLRNRTFIKKNLGGGGVIKFLNKEASCIIIVWQLVATSEHYFFRLKRSYD